MGWSRPATTSTGARAAKRTGSASEGRSRTPARRGERPRDVPKRRTTLGHSRARSAIKHRAVVVPDRAARAAGFARSAGAGVSLAGVVQLIARADGARVGVRVGARILLA